MIHRRLVPGILAALAAFPVHAQTIPADHARNLAAGCTGCHNAGGRGALGPLEGRSKEALAERMRQFKSGARTSTVMGQLAKGYTDDEIEAVAAYFAARRADERTP